METSLSILSSMMDKHQVTYTQMIGGEFNMGLYESLKDVAKAVQKADTVVLIRMESFLQIIFLGPEAADLNIRSCILLRKNQLKFPRVDG